MSQAGRDRARQFSWENITAKVDEYYAFVIRRLAAQGALPSGYHGPVPADPRAPATPVAIPVVGDDGYLSRAPAPDGAPRPSRPVTTPRQE